MEKEKVILIYAGMRLTDQKRIYKYVQEGSLERYITFGKKLLGYETIGTQIECEYNGDSTYSKFNLFKNLTEGIDDLITYWSTKERAALEEYEAKKAAKKYQKSSINGIIDDLITETRYLSRVEKNRIARYVFEKLIK